MPDITMCEGKKCPLREKCYRYKANSNELGQSYFMDEPYNKKKKECKYFWKEK